MKFLTYLLLLTSPHLNISVGNIPGPVGISRGNFVSNTINKKPSWKKERWMEMPIDHFNLFDNRTWKMRYFINDEFFQEGMPLFIAIGGERPVKTSRLTRGQLYSLTKKHRGLLVATEHRYYGRSFPLDILNLSDFSIENLQFLQIEQALEDLVYLIERLKSLTAGLQNSKVVVHGCSYAGMLATWVRLRFPNVVDIAYASSAPLGVKLDYPEYYEVVNDVYANVSESCIDIIRKGFNETQRLLRTEEGRERVTNTLKDWSCGDLDNMNSVGILRTMLTVLNVQHDPVQYEEVGCLVLSMNTDDLDDFERLANFIVLKSKETGRCRKHRTAYDKLTKFLPWKYQTCTEVGFFQTLNQQNSRHPFAVDFTLEEAVENCKKLFGEGVTKQLIQTGIERVIRRYGGKHPRVTKLLTVHGTADPWRALGKSEETDSEAPVIILRGSHCVDNKVRKDDPPELIKSREAIRDIISKWIHQL